MHELSLLTDLMRKVEAVACEQGARRVVAVHVTLGALSHLSPDHFREHFARISQGTVAEDARLEVEILADPVDPRAQEVILNHLEIEVEEK